MLGGGEKRNCEGENKISTGRRKTLKGGQEKIVPYYPLEYESMTQNPFMHHDSKSVHSAQASQASCFTLCIGLSVLGLHHSWPVKRSKFLNHI